MGLAFIMMQVKSPMLVSVGMYLPLETTFAIFVGGLVKALLTSSQRKKVSTRRKKRAWKMVGVYSQQLYCRRSAHRLDSRHLRSLSVNIWEIFKTAPIEIGIVVLALLHS